MEEMEGEGGMRREALEGIEEGMLIEVHTQNLRYIGTVTKITDYYIELIMEVPISKTKTKEVIGMIDLISIDAVIIHSGAKVKEHGNG
jgi:hypothetical protein